MPKMIKKKKKSLFIFLIMVFFILAFRSTFYESFRIPTGSMIPTLMIGDFIVVDKFAYGLKYPFADLLKSSGEFLADVFITKEKKPQRGDVVAFKYPKDPTIYYVKRIIAVPGDTIEIINKIIYVNAKKIEAERVLGRGIVNQLVESYKNKNLKFFKVNIGQHRHLIMQDNDNQYVVDLKKQKVPARKYFMMGDNRDFSYDSRFWGHVPRENIMGKAILIWSSIVFPFENNIFKFRHDRIGKVID